MSTTATHITTPSFFAAVQEYDANGHCVVMLRATARDTAVTVGLDFSPEQAMEVAEAMTRHAKALIAKVAA